jgi:uncharacterized coiled-coil DUF342 family protein
VQIFLTSTGWRHAAREQVSSLKQYGQKSNDQIDDLKKYADSVNQKVSELNNKANELTNKLKDCQVRRGSRPFLFRPASPPPE